MYDPRQTVGHSIMSKQSEVWRLKWSEGEAWLTEINSNGSLHLRPSECHAIAFDTASAAARACSDILKRSPNLGLIVMKRPW